MTEDLNIVIPDWMIFIGKWGKSVEGHPLMYHLLDSAAVAGLLWRQGLTQGARKQFSRWLQLPEADCGRLLAYWTSLHDLGKATPSFQMKHAPTQAKLQRCGFIFPNLSQTDIRHHSVLSQWILEDFSAELAIQPFGVFNQFRFAIGGHHGIFHSQEFREDNLDWKKNSGDACWQQARRALFSALTDLLKPPALARVELGQTERNAFFNLLTGFFVAADWISSQDDLFQYHPALPHWEDYRDISQRRAQAALENTGWIGWQPDGERPEFSSLFGFTPYPLQKTILESAENLQNPFLMIIEAPTGCGKTEAALMAADRAIQTGSLRGCYIAMPTQATSNQMFDRTKVFLKKRYPCQVNINLQLVHGNALINEGFQEMRLSAVEGLEGSRSGNVSALDWFLPRKRTLLAPFGVGTVDQAFLSVLRARHSFLRLFGLHRKVIIFDEVHAYDTYMQKIFSQLLAWLRAIGSSVIILSATLPEKTRLELLKVYQPAAAVQSAQALYPRLSINDGQTITTTSLGVFENRTVHLAGISRDPHTWLDLLSEKLADGGCAAVICNTVDRAQDTFRQIRAAGLVAEEDLYLLHARMPYCWRQKKEVKILDRFGKQAQPGTAARRGIVVATQIIEQSLDLDFDLLITYLAPIDLLIQRIGRLQRHTGSAMAPLRPPVLNEPLCLICQPESVTEKELPNFGKDQYVYDPAILQRTYFSLAGCQALSLPADSDALINQVYSDEPLTACSDTQNQMIRETFQKLLAEQAGDMAKAENRLIGDVDHINGLGGKIAYLKEDDQALGRATQALTRNSVLPSVQLICFIKQAGQTFLLDEFFPLKNTDAPHGKALEHALRSSISVSKSEVVQYFLARPKNEAWSEVPALRRAYSIEFENRVCPLDDGLTLTLDEALGLSVLKKIQ